MMAASKRLTTLIGALLLIAFGLAEAIGGMMLVMAGGSFAFAAIGLGTFISGIIFGARPIWGSYCYAVVLACAVLWSWSEVHGDLIQLAPRLLFSLLLGVPVLIAMLRFRRSDKA